MIVDVGVFPYAPPMMQSVAWPAIARTPKSGLLTEKRPLLQLEFGEDLHILGVVQVRHGYET